ncbi:MAG: AAA family ATPase [Spirochaetia bacterium]|nr:AAA family ATPase [Spirochaetia bacterium]
MVYLRNFNLPSYQDEENITSHWKTNLTTGTGLYPFNIFSSKEFYSLSFESPITIIYGDNGSGKSTLLNIIAEKLKLKHSAAYNRTHWFNEYISYCNYEGNIPEQSKIITSDDVFDCMLGFREMNLGIEHNRDIIVDKFINIRNEKEKNTLSLKDYVNKIDCSNPKSFIEFEEVWEAVKGSLNQFQKKRIRKNIPGKSNGENSIVYFYNKIQENALYLLDEPENSLSPERQLELLEYIQNSTIGCGCQFIIATHSPFLLSLKRSQIYDLDDIPVRTKKWTELKNVRLYRNFFIEHEDDFK